MSPTTSSSTRASPTPRGECGPTEKASTRAGLERVPKGRFELPRANAHYALNVARLPIPPLRLGGAEGTRTPDLNTASVALSRLSYSPKTRVARHPREVAKRNYITGKKRVQCHIDRTLHLHSRAAPTGCTMQQAA